MKKLAPAGLLLLGLLALLDFSRKPVPQPSAERRKPAEPGRDAPINLATTRAAQTRLPRAAGPPTPIPSAISSVGEKAARVGKIESDYAAIRLRALREYGETGEDFPGGSHTLRRQLALLDREKHADLGAVLEPHELEDLELRETSAGRLVARRLGTSAATDAQRRAVFRFQLEFELQYGAGSDATPEALLERERAADELQQRIHRVLGNALFGVWLGRDEGS